MKIAQQLKEKNIAEYLIYMWQVEDLLRANGCDIDRIRQNIILRYPEEERPALEEWYGNLADMMRAEGVTEKGHLQINRNVILNLNGTAWRIAGFYENIRSIMRLISRHCLLSWNCVRRTAGKRSLR